MPTILQPVPFPHRLLRSFTDILVANMLTHLCETEKHRSSLVLLDDDECVFSFFFFFAGLFLFHSFSCVTSGKDN